VDRYGRTRALLGRLGGDWISESSREAEMKRPEKDGHLADSIL